MDSENRMAFRRSLMPLALLAALAATSSCTDPSPLGVPAFRRGGRGQEGSTKGTGLLACSQTYDSVTQVVGPAGGFIVVGSHILWVDTMALADTVRITAVASADTVRSVRFQPDGLQFRTNGAGWSAVLFTSFKDCGDPSAVDADPPTPGLRAAMAKPSSGGLVSCSSLPYDSVTQVIGPKGGVVVVGPHFLWVDSLALQAPVTITAVAPSGRVRSVRFKPDGLVFQK